MADIFSGNGFTLSYNTDTGNRLPQGVGNLKINQLAAFPILNIKSTTQNLETYDSEYQTLLLGEQDVSPLDIVVNYIATDTTHKYLDNAASKSTEFQLVMTYQNDGQIVFAILNGVITATAITGDQNAVVTKTFTFQPTALVTRSTYAYATDPLYQGDFGVGSNGVLVPQYETSSVTGNGFIKFPANMANNPAGADLMGFGTVDATDNQALVMTKTGALNVYAKNQTTAWTRIYTVTQSDATYVPLTRTVNGHALSSNVVVTKADVGLGTVTDNPQLKIASNLSDLANVVTARTNLGLGTSAIVNTGTSGATIPLLSTANTWSGVQTFIGRTFITNLASTATGTYNGTANVTSGVTGILPLVNGGTGNATGVSTNVSGVVAVANGGTGASTAAQAAINLKVLPYNGAVTTTVDINDYGITDFYVGYWQFSATAGYASANLPEASAGVLEVIRGGDYGGLQKYTSVSGYVWIRTLTATWNATTKPWGDWKPAGYQATKAYATDLNALTVANTYSCSAGTTNKPDGITVGGWCFHFAHAAANNYYQLYVTATTGAQANRTFQRTYNGTTWTAWSESYTTLNKPSATDVGALPITGGSLTGSTGLTVTGGAVTSRENNITYRQLLSRTDAFSPYTGYNRIDQVDGTLPTAQISMGDISARLTTASGDPWGRTLGGMGMYYDVTGGGSTMIYSRNAAGNIASSITFAGDTGVATMRGSLITNAISATSLVLTTALPVASGGTGNTSGTVAALTTSRTFLTNLASTTAVAFNGTSNVTQGVTGILPLANGGNGNDTGTAVNVSGIVALTNGGTGASTAATARTALGVAYGTAAGTVAQGNDTRLNTVDGKTGGTISSVVNITATGGGATDWHTNAGGGNGVKSWNTTSNNYIELINTNGDSSSGNYINQIRGGWYTGSWSLGGVRGGSTDLDRVQINVNGGSSGQSQGFSFYANGQLSAPAGVLCVSGRVRNFSAVASTYLELVVDGTVKGMNFFDSDRTLKENIEDADGSKVLSLIEQIRPVSYKFKDYNYSYDEQDPETNETVSKIGTVVGGSHQYGVIAQEIEEIYPESVITNSDGKKSLDPLEMIGFLLTTCHEQQKMIRELQDDVKSLKE